MRFFPTLLGGGHIPPMETKDDTTIRAAGGGPRYVSWGNPLPNLDWDVERMVRDGYEKVIWLWRGIDAIADRACSLPIRAIKGDPSDPANFKFAEDPLLDILNLQASDFERARDFRYRLSSQLILSKPGVFVEVRLNKGGGVYSLSLLPPNRTTPIPDPDVFISGFRIDLANGYTYDLPAWRAGTKEPTSVLWIRKPHPLDPYSGTTPLEAAGISIDLDFWARLYNRNFMAHDGRPGGLLAIKGDVDDADAEELRGRFSGGPTQAGRVAVIEAEDVTWVDTALSPRDAQYVQSRGLTKEEILLALGVPETIIGNASMRTYDNADAEREVFWQETMSSHLSLLEHGLEGLTKGGYDDDILLWHDTSKIEVLKRSEEQKREKAQAEYDRGLITIAEYREITGRDPVDAAGARVLWIAGGKVPVGAEKDQEAAEKLTVVGPAPAAPAGGAAPGLTSQQAQANSRAGAIAGTQIARALPATYGKKDAQPSFKTGSMIALVPDRPTYARLREHAVRDDLHVTLAYLGSEEISPVERERVMSAVTYALGNVGPQSGEISAVTDFRPGPDGVPTVALIDIAGLNEIRADLVRALEMVGVPQRSEHGYTPHLTLGYDLDGADRDVAGIPVTFDAVEVVFGQDTTVIPLNATKSLHVDWV